MARMTASMWRAPRAFRASVRLLTLITTLCTVLALTALPVYAETGQVPLGGFEVSLSPGDGESQDDYVTYDAATGVLTIHKGPLGISGGSDAERIEVVGGSEVTLDGLTVANPSGGPGIKIDPGVEATLILAEGSTNTVKGAPGFAGIEVSCTVTDFASLTVKGSGTLNATGGTDSAGIGGSKNSVDRRGVYGDITIDGGTINAAASGGGAGIGSSNNPAGGTSSGSYKYDEDPWGTITINGGTITARAENGAGIGGGNHVDSGKIIVNGGDVDAEGAAGIGCGIGSSKNQGVSSTADKGPGWYFADVEINGGAVTARSNDIGAGIGGGMYCDAIIKITGGTIDATGGSREGKTHHGGAGIGGGYLGHADIEITGGDVSATGGDGAAGIGSGGSPNANELRGVNGRAEEMTTVKHTQIDISGGTIQAQGGPKGGAGIGLGVGADKAVISISGGTVRADGASSNKDEMHGGAGIGSAFQGTGTGSDKYFVDADVDIAITGGDVIAIGGWGASGIGSGADNKMADTIEIDASNTSIQAYSDGTKFAIDTRILNEDGTTTSRTDGRSVTGDLLQGTFVHAGEIGDYDQNPEGLPTILVTNDATGAQRNLTLMPEGYRSFATGVDAPGVYTVYTDADSIGHGEGRFFSCCTKDVWSEEAEGDNLVQYTVGSGRLSDNFYLFPVKSVVVEKHVLVDESVAEGGRQAIRDAVDATFHFALTRKGASGDELVKDKSGKPWIATIEVVDGVAQGKAYFAGVQDETYEVWEVDEQGNRMTAGTVFGSVVLKRITTEHGDDTSNNAAISDVVWSDSVSVNNTFGPKPTEARITPRAKKTLDGKKPGTHRFEFMLVGTSDNAAGTSMTAANDASGAIVFDALTYEEVGTYEYEMSEVEGDDEDIEYDSTVWKVVVKVAPNAKGELAATVTYDGSKSVPVFENTTTDDPDDPKKPQKPAKPSKPTRRLPATGDESRGALTLAFLAFAGSLTAFALAGLLLRGERSER